jgi:DNA-directed RNA polymerase subunit RPC12/RpoP
MDVFSDNPVSLTDKPPKQKEAEVSLVEDFFDFAALNRHALNYQIKEAHHFLTGEQWIRYTNHQQRFQRHQREDWKPTPVTNYLLRTFDRIMDIYVSGENKPVVDPATQDQSDVDGALAAQRILLSEFNRLKTDIHMHIPLAGWLFIAGTAFAYAGWDAHSGNTIRKKKTRLVDKPIEQEVFNCSDCGNAVHPLAFDGVSCPDCGSQNLEPGKVSALDGSGRPVMESIEEDVLGKDGRRQMRQVKAGQIIESVVSPLNMYVNPAKTWSNVRTCVEVEPWELDKVKAVFGAKATEHIAAEDIEFDDFGGIFGGITDQHHEEEKGQKDRVLMKFFRTVPDKRWPKGMFKIVASNELLHSGKLDDPDGNLPYEMFKYRNIPGHFWGGSLFQQLIPIQKRINSIDSHVIQNRKTMIANQWLVPDGSGLQKTSGEQGYIHRWSPRQSMGFKPERLQGVPVPAQVIQERDGAQLALEDVGGDKEVLGGDIPPGPETGAAIEALQEQALRRFTPMIKLWRSGWSDHEKRKLLLADKHWAEDRLVQTLGDNNVLEAYYLSRADMHGASDMVVRVGIGMQLSMAAKRANLMKAAGMGILGNIQDPVVRGKLLEDLDIKGYDSEYLPDAKKARRDLQKLKDGGQLKQPLPVENPAIFFQIFKEFILTSEFENLPEQVSGAILQRSQIYQQLMQQQQEAAMRQAMATKGAGPGAEAAVQQAGPGAAVTT